MPSSFFAAGAALPGMTSTWPTRSLRSSLMAFAVFSAATVTRCFAAMPPRVSPDVTVCVAALAAGAGLGGTGFAGAGFAGKVRVVVKGFEKLFAEVAAKHLGASDPTALFPGWSGARLPLFRGA